MIVVRKLYASNVELTVGIFKSWFRSHSTRKNNRTNRRGSQKLLTKYCWEKGPPLGFEPRASRGLPAAGIQSEFKVDLENPTEIYRKSS